jgi:hypothetical protein
VLERIRRHFGPERVQACDHPRSLGLMTRCARDPWAERHLSLDELERCVTVELRASRRWALGAGGFTPGRGNGQQHSSERGTERHGPRLPPSGHSGPGALRQGRPIRRLPKLAAPRHVSAHAQPEGRQRGTPWPEGSAARSSGANQAE